MAFINLNKSFINERNLKINSINKWNDFSLHICDHFFISQPQPSPHVQFSFDNDDGISIVFFDSNYTGFKIYCKKIIL